MKKIVTTEFNIEGYPSQEFIDLVCEVCPTQVTLVPDPPEALTSNNGWDTIKYADFLKEVVAKFKACGIRVMAVCPGWMRTEFLDRAADAPDALSFYGCFYVPSKVVARALRDMERGRGVSLYGTQTRLIILLSKLLPHKWVAAIWYRLQKKK